MIYIITFIVTISILIIIIIMINIFIAKKIENEIEKPSPIECGIDPFSTIIIPFSLQFFLITIIFIIFDIEVAIIIPFPITNASKNIYIYRIILFLIILLIGFYHE